MDGLEIISNNVENRSEFDNIWKMKKGFVYVAIFRNEKYVDVLGFETLSHEHEKSYNRLESEYVKNVIMYDKLWNKMRQNYVLNFV